MAKVAGWLVAVALAACVLGACGGDDDASPGPTTAAVSPQATESAPTAASTSPPSGAPTLTPSQAELAAGLPAAAELGPGWEEKARGPVTATANTLCGKAFDLTNAEVIAVYQRSGSNQVSALVGVSRPEGDVIGEVRAALDGCSELISSASGESTTYTVEIVEFDVYGDDTLAIKASQQFEGAPGPSEGFFVLVRDGELNLAVADLFIAAADPEQTRTIVAAAYEALQRVAE
jgi:hypothetical protein